MKSRTNKRKNKRSKCLVPVEAKQGSSFDQIQTVDIGDGGVGLISSKSIPVDEKIAVELDLKPDDGPVLVMGQVKWVRKEGTTGNYRVGMEFTEDLTADSPPPMKKHLSK